MRRNSLVTGITAVLGVFYLAGVTYAAEEKTEEIKIAHRTVMISAYDGVTVEPINLRSGPGTTVIWVNHSRSPVEILFLDKKVVFACGVPVNFFVGKGGAYESGKIPFGGTASLCFTEKGKYDYVVSSSSTFSLDRKQKEYEGIIWIQ
jgi:plastocyanin